uniref:Uncharacterized protein n=1 Tax=Biomphalaria glabrata TaxID=6526 RepID=A0A2C9LFB5_BIOGL
MEGESEKCIPFVDFKSQYLPVCYQDEVMMELIRAFANLTVMIEVFNKDGTLLIQGTGRINDVFLKKKATKSCSCRKCKISDSPSKEWGEIRIETSPELIPDLFESHLVKCTLFYNDNGTEEMTYIFGDRIVKNPDREDMCNFMCVTCDTKLLETLDKMVDEFDAKWKKTFDKYVDTVKSEDEKLVVLVIHPEGQRKHVVIEKWHIVEDKEEKKILFSAPKCKGSLGASILIPNFDLDIF